MTTMAIVLGTARPDGNTHSLVKVVQERTGATLFNVTQLDISPFDYNNKNRNDDFLKVMYNLVEHDHIALASPVYWYSPSSQLKVFMDRLTDLVYFDEEKDIGRMLRGKGASTIATYETIDDTRSFEEVFINTYVYLGMHYKGILKCHTDPTFVLEDHEQAITNYISAVMA